jgi:hypothetical protein
VPTVHTLLVTLTFRVIQLLPRPVRAALDGWSQRVAHRRALRRQQASRTKR